ncbi:MAG: iron ABC transporter permease [Pseudanabaenaceae cyanobacterium SKYGB_i_bin29]|nr:iron ABC transporter permease [Pseudanabaenaceae cyanobacterium SKYG29]MDW8421642.1 iron ABC transporter permease [Pseudanabaenaceae cyanobacterium SKYGB_i_bin29]
MKKNPTVYLNSSQSNSLKQWSALCITLLCLLGVILLGVGLGSVPISLAEVVQALFRRGEELNQTIVWDLRLPRVLLGVLVGAALGVAGSLMQGMLRNGLADPFLLGISAGAGLAAVVPLVRGFMLSWVPLIAWGGAIGTTALVYALSWSANGISIPRLILSGVAVSAFFGSLTSMLLLFADERVQVALNWLVGSLNGRGWDEVNVVAVYIGIGILLSISLAKFLNLLSLGDELAVSLGVSLKWMRLGIGLTSAGLTAAAVSVSGLIGFVGLVVPHLARLLVGKDYLWVVPMSGLVGALLLTGADTLARLGSVELPVGTVTALIGAPFFVWLLAKRSS